MKYRNTNKRIIHKDISICLDNSQNFFFQAMKGLTEVLKNKLCKDPFDCVGEEDLNDFRDSDVVIEFHVSGDEILLRQNGETGQKEKYHEHSEGRFSQREFGSSHSGPEDSRVIWNNPKPQTHSNYNDKARNPEFKASSQDDSDNFILLITYSDLYRLDNQGRIVFNFRDTNIHQSDQGCRVVFQQRFFMRFYLHMIYKPAAEGTSDEGEFWVGFMPISSSDFGGISMAVSVLLVLILLGCLVLAGYIVYRACVLRQEEKERDVKDSYTQIDL